MIFITSLIESLYSMSPALLTSAKGYGYAVQQKIAPSLHPVTRQIAGRLRVLQRKNPKAALLGIFAIITILVSAPLTLAVANDIVSDLTQTTPSQPVPETFYIRPLPDNVAVRRYYPLINESGKRQNIRVIPSKNKPEASVFIDGKELVRFRQTATLSNPYRAGLQFGRALHLQLANGSSPSDIHMTLMPDGSVNLELGKVTLAHIDTAQAIAASNEKHPITPQKLATIWHKHIDKAFDVERRFSENYIASGFTQTGEASWYGPGFNGRRTANGERYDMNGITAAHKTLPFGTLLEVTNQWTGKQVIVRVNDRGPYAHGRIIDLSKGAAEVIGLTSSGVAPVTIVAVEPKTANDPSRRQTSSPKLALVPTNGIRLPVLPKQIPSMATPAVALPQAN
jgi:rare lipoprotein A